MSHAATSSYATRQPLAGCHLLVDAIELLENVSKEIDPTVASDFFGGVQMIAASFQAAMMAVNQNLKADLLTEVKTAQRPDELNSRRGSIAPSKAWLAHRTR